MTSTKYQREKYLRPGEKERLLRNNETRRKRTRDAVRSIAAEQGCQDCGNADVRVLQFHHKDPAQKSFGIADAVSNGRAWEKILAEIAKCEVLCANCHAIRHFHGE